MSLLDAVAARKSHSKVTSDAPTHAELLPLVAAAASVADYGSLRPWRLIELRDDARSRLGTAFAEAVGLEGHHAEKLASKPLRASLLIAVVAVNKPSHKVLPWEQDVATAGVAHTLSLLLHDAGWGVMWRTGPHVDAPAVRELHGLADNERLFGWLYVGGLPEKVKPEKKSKFDPESVLSQL
ncbi:nitroreductase [Glaciihabitans tibetensis]|uniref:Putative NAD(P)H nitroreductase n=1 Tax=Glaciihabitans tibetensis TaxID=1266600 RepID=A0A2T0VAS2_9MICO|nr:nitroreductase family protein [Glaciihabitans tibetensis]PRY67168.1 nitroreductase [Glaciihabitans tibetensis]